MHNSTLINLHPNEYSQELRCYPFTVNQSRCVGICNILDDLSSRVCVPNETKDSNLHVFNMVTGTNESNVNVNLIVFNVTQIKSGITISVGVSVKIQKNNVRMKKNYIWNPACKNGKYVGSRWSSDYV